MLRLLKPLAWPEVFAFWRENEESLAHWQTHWRERGFSSWEEWRTRYAEAFGCADKMWKLYEIKNPATTVAAFYGGPFQSWQKKFYHGERSRQFSELAHLPEIQNHSAVVSMTQNFPFDKVITGLKLSDEKIVIIEGMHRCATLGVLHSRGEEIPAPLRFALAPYTGALPPVVGGYRKK